MNNLCGHILYTERYAGRYPKNHKYYRAFIHLVGPHLFRTSSCHFKRASEADAYAKRWRARVIRFYGFPKQEKLSEF